MFRIRGTLSDYDREQAEQCFLALQDNCHITTLKDSDISKTTRVLRGFEILKGWDDITVAALCSLSRNSRKVKYCILVMDKTTESVGSRGQKYTHHINEAYQLFIVDLKEDLGHISIRPETIIDKISELFGNIDIDFRKHPLFSKRYFVLAATRDDESKFRKQVEGKFLETIAQHKDLRIETKAKKMIVMTGTRINQGDAVKLAEFVFELE